MELILGGSKNIEKSRLHFSVASIDPVVPSTMGIHVLVIEIDLMAFDDHPPIFVGKI